VLDTQPAPPASRGSQRSVRPTGVERTVSGDELIVSKTDPRGVITTRTTSSSACPVTGRTRSSTARNADLGILTGRGGSPGDDEELAVYRAFVRGLTETCEAAARGDLEAAADRHPSSMRQRCSGRCTTR